MPQWELQLQGRVGEMKLEDVMVKRVGLLLVVALLASSALAKKKPSPQVDLEGITARGRLLAEYDVAAWHSTDAVQAMHPEKGRVRRFIGRKTDAGWIVSYGRLNDSGNRFLVVYEATQGATPQQFTVKEYDPPKEDTGFEYFGAQAIETVARDFRGENRRYNVAVLPADSNQMYVYVYPAQTRQGIYPLGGDVRYLISVDGSSIVEKRQLHKAILELSYTSTPDRKVEGGSHSHVLSDVPEDTDVFFVLTRKPSIPEYIGTKNVVYVVETDGTIRVAK